MDWADDQLAALKPRFPDWDIWFVREYVGGQTWCAKPAGARIATVHAESPDALATQLQEQEIARH